MPHRTRSEFKRYHRYLKKLPADSGCEFCKFSKGSSQFADQTGHFWIIKNIFPYSLWDELGVEDHLLVVPKKHTDTLSSLPDKAAVEFVDLISSYENRGYSVYARAPGNPIKSVLHQHTHLIKSDNRRRKLLIFVRKPHLRFTI
jgi:diadenosine tetraphosphate (Ap4A) HIT family hydrolase